jgi:hypothetical protein
MNPNMLEELIHDITNNQNKLSAIKTLNNIPGAWNYLIIHGPYGANINYFFNNCKDKQINEYINKIGRSGDYSGNLLINTISYIQIYLINTNLLDEVIKRLKNENHLD